MARKTFEKLRNLQPENVAVLARLHDHSDGFERLKNVISGLPIEMKLSRDITRLKPSITSRDGEQDRKPAPD